MIPRSWTALQFQRAPTQTPFEAEPMATSGRFKGGAFVLCICLGVIIYSLHHSVRHYFLRRSVGALEVTINPNPSALSNTLLWLRHVPPRIAVQIVALAGMIAYQILCAFLWNASLLNAHGNLFAVYLGGHAPVIIILLTQCIWGFCTTNEDKIVIRRRRARGIEYDRELGVIHKPAWWSLRKQETVREALERRGRQISRRPSDQQTLDIGSNTTPPLSRQHTVSNNLAAAPLHSPAPIAIINTTPAPNRSPRIINRANLLSPEQQGTAQRAGLMLDGPPPPSYFEATAPQPSKVSVDQQRSDDNDTLHTTTTSQVETLNGSSQAPRSLPSPQRVRSMLEI